MKAEWEREPKPRTLTKLIEAEKKLAELHKKTESKQETGQSQPNFPQLEKQFSWLWVVIPMGILIIGLIFLVFWLWRKKNK